MKYFALIYGILTIIGGVIGYATKGSTVSLMAGGISGLLILLCAFAYLKGQRAGIIGLAVMAVALLGFFTPRFLEHFAFMPAGLMVVLSIIALIGSLLDLRKPALKA